MKTDWGISLFFLTPLALVALPSLRIRQRALFHIAAIWLVLTLATLAAAPYIAAREMAEYPNNAASYGARSQLARELIRIIDIDKLQSAYRVRFAQPGSTLQWLTGEDDNEMALTTEPDSTFSLRLQQFLLSPLVPEELL